MNAVLWKLRPHVPVTVLVSIYNALILPLLSYCTIIWGKSAGSSSLCNLQKNSMRALEGIKDKAHSDPIYSKHKVLKVEDICRQQLHMEGFKALKGQLPGDLSNLLRKPITLHSYNTRGASTTLVSDGKNKFSVLNQVAMEWNSFSISFKNLDLTMSSRRWGSKKDLLKKYEGFKCKNDHGYTCNRIRELQASMSIVLS